MRQSSVLPTLLAALALAAFALAILSFSGPDGARGAVASAEEAALFLLTIF